MQQRRPAVTMRYLAHTAHAQFLGLVLGFLAWIFVMVTSGLNDWRMWLVHDAPHISSGVAWVGIWRACFLSHTLSEVENCRDIGISDPFAPPEIAAAQVLMMLAAVSGLAANVCGGAAMRLAYFSVRERRGMRRAFVLAGVLHLMTAGMCLGPLLWNMTSVLNNNTIHFPPEFQLPAAPDRQYVGPAIGVGLFASALTLISGLLFLCYRYAWRSPGAEEPPGRHGRDNPAYQQEDAC